MGTAFRCCDMKKAAVKRKEMTGSQACYRLHRRSEGLPAG